MEIIGTPCYGIIDSGVFGLRIISGIVTGVRYTEDDPIYEISFGKDKWWSSVIAQSKDNLLSKIALPDLKRVKETFDLKIKYNK